MRPQPTWVGRDREQASSALLVASYCLPAHLSPLYSLVIGQFPLISDPTLSYMSPKCQQPANKKHGLQFVSRQHYLSNLCSCIGSLPLLSYTNLSGFQWGLNIETYWKGPQTVSEMWQVLSDTSISNKSGQEVLFCVVRWKKNLRNPTRVNPCEYRETSGEKRA